MCFVIEYRPKTFRVEYAEFVNSDVTAWHWIGEWISHEDAQARAIEHFEKYGRKVRIQMITHVAESTID